MRFLRGNGDRETVTPPAGGPLAEIGGWAAARLGPDRLDRVARWPATVELEVAGSAACSSVTRHRAPTTDILTAATPDVDVAAALAGVAADVVVCGHTHVQYDRRVGSIRVVNAGSVGMPYEGSPDARWAILGDGEIALVSTPYDAEAALAALWRLGLPDARRLVRRCRPQRGHRRGGDGDLRGPASWRVATSATRDAAGSERGESGSVRSSSASPPSTPTPRSPFGSTATSSCSSR